MQAALTLYFEKEGKIITGKDLKITLDLPQFFEFYKVVNAKALSERIGLNQSLLARYIKGNKKPSPTQTQRILKGVQQIGNDWRLSVFCFDKTNENAIKNRNSLVK